MNSKREKETVLRNKTQQEIKCKPQSDNKNVRKLDFDVNDIISFGDKDEARTYLEKHYKFDAFANETEFLECLKGFAKQGDPIMQNLLGVCLCAGYGCEENPRKAIQWWTKAAEQGEVCSQRCLGGCYYTGDLGIGKNYKKAVYWLEKAAHQNDNESQMMLGECYRMGQGCDNNLKTATFWYTKAAEMGNSEAMYILGVCYYNGDGVRKSRKRAFEYFKMAAEEGYPEAQYQLANFYLHGCSVKADIWKAWELYNMAAEQGHVEAKKLVNEILRD